MVFLVRCNNSRQKKNGHVPMKTADAASWFQTQQDNDIEYQRKT